MTRAVYGVTLAVALCLTTVPVAPSSVRQLPQQAVGACRDNDNPDVLLCDDFEDATLVQQWNISSHYRYWPRADFVMCQEGFGFGDSCAAWSNRLIFDGFWGYWGYDARRVFLPQNRFYVRWYQYISNPYHWGTLEDKSLILHDPAETITAILATNRDESPAIANSGPGMPFVANYQDFDWAETGGRFTAINRFQNQGRNIALVPGRWYLFEWYVALNTPGQSDGVTSLWIDDATHPIERQTLRMHYTDMRWLRSRDAGRQFGMVRLTVYDQRCDRVPNTCPPFGPNILDQSHRWDSIVVSTSPIGPIRPPASR
jgi:hypothetical protein